MFPLDSTMGSHHGATELSKQQKLILQGKTVVDKSAWIKAW